MIFFASGMIVALYCYYVGNHHLSVSLCVTPYIPVKGVKRMTQTPTRPLDKIDSDDDEEEGNPGCGVFDYFVNKLFLLHSYC